MVESIKQHLTDEKEKVAKSLQYWRNQFAEAERQIYIHTGHVERIDLLLAHILQAENNTDNVENADESAL